MRQFKSGQREAQSGRLFSRPGKGGSRAPRFTDRNFIKGQSKGPFCVDLGQKPVILLMIAALAVCIPAFRLRRASRCPWSSRQPDMSEHVLGDIGHADLHLRPAHANRADEELHLVLLSGKTILVPLGKRHEQYL